MRILVTGGSGFLGSHVVEQALAAGYEVSCLVRKSSDTSFLSRLGVTLVEGALDKAETLAGAVDGIDAIVHCAGLVKARTQAEFDAVHTGGTVALAKAAIEAGRLKRFVHVSTAAVMGVGKKGTKHLIEDTPTPVTMYAKSKLAAERALLELKDQLPITILRPPAIYGPRDREILAFFQMVRRTRMAFRMGHSLQSVSMVFGPDCAKACVASITKDVPSGARYFVDDGYTYTFEDMAHAIAAAYEIGLLGAPRLPIPLVKTAALASELFGRVADKTMMFTRDKLPELLMQHFVVDGQATQKDLGWKPQVPFAEGAKITARWYRENRWD